MATLFTVLDSIAASLFENNWLSWQIVSDDKLQISLLRRGALSKLDFSSDSVDAKMQLRLNCRCNPILKRCFTHTPLHLGSIHIWSFLEFYFKPPHIVGIYWIVLLKTHATISFCNLYEIPENPPFPHTTPSPSPQTVTIFVPDSLNICLGPFQICTCNLCRK